MNDWEVVADNLKKRDWSLGWVSAVDCQGRTIWIVDAHRDEGKRFVVRAAPPKSDQRRDDLCADVLRKRVAS
jgi:hypothetical protein